MSGLYGNFVLEVHSSLFGRGDVSVLESAFAADFVEHSPLIPEDRYELRKMIEEKVDSIGYSNERVLADGQFVALHGKFTGIHEIDLVGFDIYRIENGKIVEHWDSFVPVADLNESGRTQLDGPTLVDSSADEDDNRKRTVEFFTECLIRQQYEGFRRFTLNGLFRQHSPDIADGTENVIEFLTELKNRGEGLVYNRIKKIVADGQFVLTYSEGSIAGTKHLYAELWYWEDGFITEMWDAITEISK